MRRNELSEGDTVAIYPHHPVPVDPYARTFREMVREAKVQEPHGADGGVLITYAYGGSSEWVEPRQVLARWGDWTAQLQRRVTTAAGQEADLLEHMEAEARALAIAQAKWPTSELVNRKIVVPIEDFLATES